MKKGQHPNEALRYHRLLRGWSQQRVADEIGAISEMISRWERGQKKTSIFYQEKLCALFGMNAEELGFLSSPTATNTSRKAPAQKPGSHLDLLLANNRETIQRFDAPFVLSAHQYEELSTHSSHNEIRQQKIFNTITVEMSYPRWVAAMETFWQLYFAGGIPVIEVGLPGLLRELLAAANESSRMQKQMMALTSQAYQMQWLLSLQRQDFGQALLAIDQAYIYSQGSQDANLELASLVRKAHVYFHLKNPVKQLFIHEQAIQYADAVSPLMRSWFYLLLAENHASLRHQKETAEFLDLAHKVLPDNPIHDEAFSYVRMNAYLISNFEMICQLHLHQPQKVLDTLEYLGLSDKDPRCSELLNHRLTALFLLHDMEELHHSFPLAINMAKQTKSVLRSHEVYGIYCKMIERWPKEQKVQELKALLPL